MKIKGRGVLTICLLLFGGAAFYDYYSSVKNEQLKNQDTRLMLLDFQQVEKIEIHRADEDILLRRDPGGWKLEKPFAEAADSEFVDLFVKDIYPQRILDVATEGSAINWSQYGLAPAFATITLTDSKGAHETFHISEKKNFEGNVFARRNEESKVLILNPTWEARSRKTVLDFRDRRVLRFAIASVDELTLRNNQGSFTLQRVDGKWKVRGFGVELDQNKVRALLTELSQAKADQVEEATKAVAGQKPLFELHLTMQEKKWSAKVSQSAEGDKKIFALVSDPKLWLRIEPGALDEFIKKELKSLEVTPVEVKSETAPEAASAPHENMEPTKETAE